jgi:hypothetical protein
MVLDGPLGHARSIRDLAIAVASHHESQDFGLALCKWVRRV